MDIYLNTNQKRQFVTHKQYLGKYQQVINETYAISLKSSVNRKLKDKQRRDRRVYLATLHLGTKCL